MSKKVECRFMTINNYTEEDKTLCREFCENYKIVYAIFGLEHITEGTPHIQAFVRVKNALSLKTWSKWFPRAHLMKECHRATDYNRYVYCSKEQVWFECGTRPTEDQVAGKRNDISLTREKLEEGANMRDILNNIDSVQAHRFATNWLSMNEKARDWKPFVCWIYGNTGSGKSRTVREICKEEDTWTSKDSFQWWDGYDAHSTVVIDDFRGDYCKFSTLLKILDRYPYSIAIKGGFRQLLAKSIYITSNKHPSKCYDRSDEDIRQLLRRIDVIEEMNKVATGHEVEGNSRASTSSNPPNAFGGAPGASSAVARVGHHMAVKPTGSVTYDDE